MASFNDNRRGEGPKRRPEDARRRRQSVVAMEWLENRRLLTGGNPTAPPTWLPTNGNLLDAQNGPMANLGTDVVKAYGEYLSYVAAGSKGTFTPTVTQTVLTKGNTLGIDVRGYGNFTTFENSLISLGMTVTATVPKYDYVEGYIPYANLPKVAELGQTVGGNPIYKPVAFQQGISPNQADVGANIAPARAKFNVDGTGQTVGVLSTDDGFTDGLINNSIKSGDLPSNVNTIDDSSGTTDGEGRAMLEQIYDLAPKAGLAYATGFNGEASFASNVQKLYAAGASTIVDDIGYFLDPFYQDGIIQQSVNTVVAQGATYLSSAGNQSDSGYESQFRPVSTTVGSLGAGTYMNFDPTGATTTTQLGINVYTPGTGIVLQFDQPFYTTNGVTSNVEIDVLDQSGNVVQQANMNNVAVQQPTQITGGLAVGLYTVVIKVDSGPNPGHVVFYATGDGGFSVDTKFGSAGGTYYPSTHGHNAGPTTISVGAAPYWSTPYYTHTPTLNNNEPFSSTGPVLTLFNGDGTPTTPTLQLKPDLTSTDGNNTSFFGFNVNTTQPSYPANPPYPGDAVTTFADPTTPTNQSVGTLPSFFGTSSAAPNLAAIVALMKQSNPTLTRNQILANLDSTTTSLNGIPAGTWSPQAGYGLVNALAALSAVQSLSVLSIVPGSNQTVSSIPNYLTVTFNQSVDIRTLSAANLGIIGANGASVAVGQPVGVDSATFPSIVRFPITITPAAGVTGNGIYQDAVYGSFVTSQNGQHLNTPYFDRFNLQDIQGPRVTATSFVGRVVNITFNEPLNASTVTPNNIFLFRNGGVNNANLGPNAIVVSQLPGAKFSYNAATMTVTLDLTAVPQSSLPTDHYGLVVRTSVTDGVNNPLNGQFNGIFPSGTNPPTAAGSTFFQDLGVVTLQAPIITSLSLAPASDSGILGDNNTNVTRPSLVGQVTAKFPGAVGGLLVYAEFNGIAHQGVPNGGLDLTVGASGRGFNGHYDVQTTTDAQGRFTILYPPGLNIAGLPDGLNQVRIVVVGAPDAPPLPGLAAAQTTSFRVDTTLPIVSPPAAGGPATSIVPGQQINSLTNLTINFADPVAPQTIGSPFAVPATLSIPALNPATASNVGNYKLALVTANGVIDESSFITSATFVPTSARVLTSDPYTGQVQLTFAPGLPAGNYQFFVLSSAYGGAGLSDAAGNPFNGGYNGTFNYSLSFTLQPTPTYITSYVAYTSDPNAPNGLATSGPRANYEIPVSGITPRAEAPPGGFSIDFSNSLDPNANYTQDVELVGSANPGTTLPDGNFGDLGITNTPASGFTIIQGTTVTLTNSVAGALPGQYGYHNRLLVLLPAGYSLPADYYRVYLPNTGSQKITDVFGNQLDGEFLGYQNASGKYVDQIQNGQVRGAGATALPDLSGDGVAGGAFMTGFVVVPNGNIIYAAADAIYNPLIPSQTPDGSLARPFPVLAPEAVPNSINGGDLNSPVNAGTNFNTTYDRSGDGQFEPSALFAAQQRLQETGGPVVVIAEASIPTRDPVTGAIIQKPFVLQAPNPSGGQTASIANDASTALPALTTLVLDPGVTLKMQNAALLVQNQGSALQIIGGANAGTGVTVTSYKDSSIGGVTNGDPNSTPSPGDYGGIVFRNFSQAALPGQDAARADLFPGQIPVTGVPLTDNRLKGQFANPADPASQVDAISGADDIMSSISFLTERYAGGTVPQTIGNQYDGITLLNSRPAIVNSIIASAGGAGSAVAGLSSDVDSLRADDVAHGPLIRNDQFVNNGLNGIYIRANVGYGVAEPTDAESYPTNTTYGGSNYVFNNPYPYLLTSKMQIGEQLAIETSAVTNTTDRLSIIPGSLVKFETGAWLEIGQDDGFGLNQGTSASLVVGDPTYINEYDNNNNISPSSPGFKANSSQLAKVIFTSFNDNAATTSYTDPVTQVVTTIVAALPALPASALTPAPAKGDWGGIQLDAGSRDTINSAIFNYGGGFINTPAGASTLHALELNRSDAEGSFVSITNNNFNNNADVPINTSPNVWLATDPSRPLSSGAPFIHGNVFIGNDDNGVGVQGGTLHNAGSAGNYANLDVNSVWSGSDFTYFLRDTIVLAGGIPQAPPANRLVATPTPIVDLTLQSTLPGTVLADGTTVAAPGVPLIIKLLNVGSQPQAETLGAVPTANILNSYQQGASFVVGVDNNVDPPADSLVDPGAFSEIRVVGIGGNQTTGQARVPVVITSAHDNTVGTTVNGVQMYNLITGDQTLPTAGDGGIIYYGGNSLTNYNLFDPRSGPIIDNADLKYMTRVEQQGGGLIYGVNGTVGGTAFLPTYDNLFGLPLASVGPNGATPDYADQYNSPKSLVISNSNFSNFSFAGVYAHPNGVQPIILAVDYTTTTPIARASNYNGEPTHTFLVNDTFSNMPTGVYILSQPSSADVVPNNGPYPTPTMAVVLNSDFYNDGFGVHTNGQGGGLYNHTATLVMDSIFQGSTTAAVQFDGENFGGVQNQNQNHAQTIIPSQVVYDDFYGNVANVIDAQAGGLNPPTVVSQAIFTDPGFRSAPTGNFFLKSTSSVIDLARSELGPSVFGDMLYPQVTAVDPTNLTGPTVRNVPVYIGGIGPGNFFGTLDQTQPAGDINFEGGLGYTNGSTSGPNGAPYYGDIVTLPGRLYPGTTTGPAQIPFPDQWIPVLQSNPNGTIGNVNSKAVYAYVPITGERDQAGNLRVKDPLSPNLGYGSKPYFDLGAFEYIVQNPPLVEGVAATTSSGVSNIYGVGTVAGVNKLPTSISFLISERLDPTTINGMSVLLEASGGDGIFGNNNSPLDRFINVSGLTSFDPNTDVLTINTSSIFTSLATASDEYRVILKGTGSAVIRDNSGLALDGFNLDASGNQLPLPSGSDNFPGSDFQVTFTIDTHPPAIVPGTFRLDPASDTSGAGLNITNIKKPTFTGTITDSFPPTNFLQGQTVIIDLSTQNNGVFDILNAGVGTTDASGNFRITLTTPIPDTLNKVGIDGHQEGPGSGLTYVRVRVIDQSGNASNLPTDPIGVYGAEQALTGLQEDTVLPKVSAFSPTANTVAQPNANGQIVITSVFTKNIKTSTLNANSILVQRSGGTGNFNNPIAVPITAGSFTFSYSTNPATLGYETVTFSVSAALPNDQYRVVLKGTGATPITDLASNPLDGQGIGTGSDYVNGTFILFTPSNAHLIYVGPAGSGTTGVGTVGTRENPFTTIAAGMAAALIGDDVLVLPGVYNENVTLKPGVRLLSAATNSTDTSFTAGSPYQTLIYGVSTATSTPTASGAGITTLYAAGGITGIPTEVSGFSLVSPLLGDPNRGVLDTTDVAVRTLNSNVQIDRNIIVNAGVGIYLATAGANVPTSQVFDNLIVGNGYGIEINDNGATSSIQSPFAIINNTIADNTIGVFNISSTPGQTQALVINNIFYSNHDLTTARAGTGIASNRGGTLAVGDNLFYQNGKNGTPASNATGTFNGFNPANLSTTPDPLGNLIGNPYFNAAYDPRPNADTPAVFFNYSNYDLTKQSVAINAADPRLAPGSDFLYRTPVSIAGHGFPGTGPASIGAFYFGGKTGPSGGTGTIYGPVTGTGTGTSTSAGKTATVSTLASALAFQPTPTATDSTVGGGIALGTKQFSVVTSSVAVNGTVQSGVTIEPGPGFIDVDFSNNINALTASPADLVLTGTGLSSVNPAHATSMAWIDDHAIRFFLTGGYANGGTVNVSIPQGALTDTNGTALVGFKDSFQVGTPAPVAPVVPVATPTLVNTAAPVNTVASTVAPAVVSVPVVQPVAAAPPVAGPPAHKLTAKELKQQAAQVKAQQAAEAKAAKAAAKVAAAKAKAAHKAAKAK
jgi:hypothetical protein